MPFVAVFESWNLRHLARQRLVYDLALERQGDVC